MIEGQSLLAFVSVPAALLAVSFLYFIFLIIRFRNLFHGADSEMARRPARENESQRYLAAIEGSATQKNMLSRCAEHGPGRPGEFAA